MKGNRKNNVKFGECDDILDLMTFQISKEVDAPKSAYSNILARSCVKSKYTKLVKQTQEQVIASDVLAIIKVILANIPTRRSEMHHAVRVL